MDDQAIAKKFGIHLKSIRLEKKLSQEKLGLLSGLHPTFISMLETGKKQPSLSTIVALAACLDVKASELLAPF